MKYDASHLLDAAVPLLVGAIIAVGVVVRADASTRPLALALALAAAAVLVLRRRAPTATLAVSGVLVLALFAVDHAAGSIAVIAPAAALYTLALTRGRIHLVAAVAAAAAAVAVADIFLAGHHTHALTLQTAAHVALIAVPVLAAEALRNRRSYVQVLLEQLELAERSREEEAQRRTEQERLRIARDLHDVVAHTLTTINVQAGVAAHLLDRDPNNAKEALTTIETASHEALDELRTILGVLREPDDVDAPLAPAPDLAALDTLIEQARSTGLDVSLTVDGKRPQRIPDAVQLAAFRILQESLTNARRHAPGAAAHVNLAYQDERLRLAIENDADPSRTGNGGPSGVGILGMRERATALGGTLQAHRSGGGGSRRCRAALPAPRVIRVLVADDQVAVRSGFAALIAAEEEMEVVGEAGNGREAVDLARRVFPHVVLMDIRMPVLDGIEATRLICADPTLPDTRVLVLTTFDLDEYVYAALRAGASGFLLKDAGPGELLHAIRTVAAGDALLAPWITRRLIAEFAARPDPRAPLAQLAALTERENEILRLVATGLNNADIAGRLVISPLTAKTHVGRILSKLDCHDRAQLVALAYESGLVTPGGRDTTTANDPS